MADIGEGDLTSFFNLNNILWLTVFSGSLSTAYWRIRKFLTDRNKEYIKAVADDVKKTIIEEITHDNIVAELNFTEKLDSDAKIIKSEMDKRFETVNTCNKRIEDKLQKHDDKLTALDTKVDVHIARAEEQSKALDRVTKIVDQSLQIVHKAFPVSQEESSK